MGIFDSEKTYYNRATVYLNKGEFQKAIKYFDKSLKINPNYYKSWNDKGIVFLRLNIFNEALTCFNNALAIKPEYSLSLLNKASLLLNNLYNYEEAIICFDKALNMNQKVFKKGIKGTIFKYPDIYADIWNSKGLALFHLEKHEEAIKCYERALELNSSHLHALKNKEIAENELNNLKVECSNCGTLNIDTSEFCQKCGNKLNSNNELVCSNCNALINAETKYCPKCGHIIKDTMSSVKTCPNCNLSLNNEANFCPECGENLEIKKEIILVDVNNDSEDKIISIPGVGPILAKKVIKIRESNNGFESVDDFCMLMELKPHVANKIKEAIICKPIKNPKNPKYSGRVVDW